jgi:hypothetical protein
MSSRTYGKTCRQVLWTSTRVLGNGRPSPSRLRPNPAKRSAKRAPSRMNGSFPARRLPLRLSQSGRSAAVTPIHLGTCGINGSTESDTTCQITSRLLHVQQSVDPSNHRIPNARIMKTHRMRASPEAIASFGPYYLTERFQQATRLRTIY